jgi:ribosomal 30S subunit maturation factor RimM
LPDAKQPWVQVAHVLRYRGNKGEVAAELQTDFPERISTLKEVWLRKDAGEPKAVGLQKFWIDRNHPRIGIFHFAGSATISDAEKWRGYDSVLEIQTSTGELLVPLAEDLCPRIDVVGRRIDVRLPEGLKDINS